MDMLCDLRMWKEAKSLSESAGNIDLKALLHRQAKSAEEDGDLRAASELYLVANEYNKAISIMGENKWLDGLIEICRALNKYVAKTCCIYFCRVSDAKAIALCAEYFTKHKHHAFAKEAYTKIDDYPSLVQLHVDMQKWEDAFQLLELHPKFTTEVYLPYAMHLALQDQYEEAQAVRVNIIFTC